jgi:crossover junction endodeoxyribonuclease RuvC
MENELPPTSAVILSCDPGLSGAVCCLKNGSIELRRDFKKREDIAYAIQSLSAGVTHAVIEFVAARPGQGVCSVWSFGRAAGVADGAFALCCPALTVKAITPQVWQRFFREKFQIPREQDFDSRAIAIGFFPAQADLFRRKLDHNSADATLLAVYQVYQLSIE